MNNVQLYIVAGLPTVTVLVGILLNQRSLGILEHRMDRLEARLDRIEADLR